MSSIDLLVLVHCLARRQLQFVVHGGGSHRCLALPKVAAGDAIHVHGRGRERIHAAARRPSGDAGVPQGGPPGALSLDRICTLELGAGRGYSCTENQRYVLGDHTPPYRTDGGGAHVSALACSLPHAIRHFHLGPALTGSLSRCHKDRHNTPSRVAYSQ
jgi:hypothetical protein